ncbi:substrate-binding domain-containing protein, partial [Mycobacterium tuberculosis]|nr:substrate-binding domain-containing protein [Mycobacterium tuberculosis]
LQAIRFEEDGFAAAYDAIRGTGFEPTAFFCSHDGLALTVITELLSRGRRIPEDVSVVGFGDYSIATQISPALTTVRVPGDE